MIGFKSFTCIAYFGMLLPDVFVAEKYSIQYCKKKKNKINKRRSFTFSLAVGYFCVTELYRFSDILGVFIKLISIHPMTYTCVLKLRTPNLDLSHHQKFLKKTSHLFLCYDNSNG